MSPKERHWDRGVRRVTFIDHPAKPEAVSMETGTDSALFSAGWSHRHTSCPCRCQWMCDQLPAGKALCLLRRGGLALGQIDGGLARIGVDEDGDVLRWIANLVGEIPTRVN